VLALAAGLAESLAAIHAAGVVHRDLKPSNVLLGQDGPCVIDFGISRAAEATSVTRAGFVLGSPGFMSPEQAEGLEVGPPTDIFSLGAVLAFAATGKPPFGTGSTAAMVYRIVYANPHLDDVPDGVRPMIARCLAKDPSQRPSATELLAEAEAVQPMTGWLPDPIINAFPDAPAPAVAEQQPLTIEPEEPRRPRPYPRPPKRQPRRPKPGPRRPNWPSRRPKRDPGTSKLRFRKPTPWPRKPTPSPRRPSGHPPRPRPLLASLPRRSIRRPPPTSRQRPNHRRRSSRRRSQPSRAGRDAGWRILGCSGLRLR
jgi:serine/threonine protein kinase